MASQSALEHAKVILAAIIPNRRDLLDKALRHLTADHFPDPTLAKIFTWLENFSRVTGAVLPLKSLEDLLRKHRVDAGKAAHYMAVYSYLAGLQVEDSDFLWSLQQVRELAAERATGDAITEGMEILTSGSADKKGRELKGHQDARHHILTRFSEIDKTLAMQESPEGNMRHEADSLIAEYAERKRLRVQGLNRGYEIGIPTLDQRIGGLEAGELDLFIGWTGDGKSSLCVQLAWNVTVNQRKNVVYATTENLRDNVRQKVISRHSMLPQFELPTGLNSLDIRRATLTSAEEKKYQEIVYDFDYNNNNLYGNLYIIQVPRGATISSFEGMLLRIQRMFEIDLVVADYLRLWHAEKRAGSLREDLSYIIQDAKQLAVTFNDGKGICIVSPWQVGRPAKEDADRNGFYSLSSLSETAEAANTPDVIISTHVPNKPYGERYVEMKAQVLKNRPGVTSPILDLKVDYGTSTFTTMERADNMDGLLGSSGNGQQGLLPDLS